MRLTLIATLALPLLAAPALAQTTTDQPPAPGATPRDGVIRPPTNTDPGITKQPPSAGATDFPTPVVPPPGAPGGKSDVVPK